MRLFLEYAKGVRRKFFLQIIFLLSLINLHEYNLADAFVQCDSHVGNNFGFIVLLKDSLNVERMIGITL